MAVTQLADVIVPQIFTDYLTNNTMIRTALLESGAAVRNAVIERQLQAGADMFSVPAWNDLGNAEPEAVNDDPNEFAQPRKVGAVKQRVRKFFAHSSWGAMSFASELAGSDAIQHIQRRVMAYWNRQVQARIVASLEGIMADNIANDAGDMVNNISALSGDAAKFNRSAVIDAAATLGDAMDSVKAILMHSHVYQAALKADDVDFIPDSTGKLTIPTYMGLAVVVDDGMPVNSGTYVSALMGLGAVGFGMTAPSIAPGTELENVPAAGNGGGMQILHTRMNIAATIAGFDWLEGTLTESGPMLADLRLAAHWNRVVERKAVPVAFLLTK